MVGFVRLYGWKSLDSIRQDFAECGADEIIIDDYQERKNNSEAYQQAKQRATETGILIIDNLDSIGKTSREIAKELDWFSSQRIALHVIAFPSTVTTGTEATDILRDVYAQLAEEERERVKKAQQAGIRKAQAGQKKLGRTRIPYPDNWDENYSKWQRGELTIDQFMQETGLKRGTLYNLIKACKEEKAPTLNSCG